jgi:hypothetical protein
VVLPGLLAALHSSLPHSIYIAQSLIRINAGSFGREIMNCRPNWPHVRNWTKPALRGWEGDMSSLAIKGNGLQSKLLWAAVIALGALSFGIVALS